MARQGAITLSMGEFYTQGEDEVQLISALRICLFNNTLMVS